MFSSQSWLTALCFTNSAAAAGENIFSLARIPTVYGWSACRHRSVQAETAQLKYWIDYRETFEQIFMIPEGSNGPASVIPLTLRLKPSGDLWFQVKHLGLRRFPQGEPRSLWWLNYFFEKSKMKQMLNKNIKPPLFLTPIYINWIWRFEDFFMDIKDYEHRNCEWALLLCQNNPTTCYLNHT